MIIPNKGDRVRLTAEELSYRGYGGVHNRLGTVKSWNRHGDTLFVNILWDGRTSIGYETSDKIEIVEAVILDFRGLLKGPDSSVGRAHD